MQRPKRLIDELRAVSESQLEESKSQPGANQHSSEDGSSHLGRAKNLFFENALVENTSVVSNEIDMKSPGGLGEEDDRPSSGVKDNSRSPISDKMTSERPGLSLEQRIDQLVRKVAGTYKEDVKKRLGIESED